MLRETTRTIRVVLVVALTLLASVGLAGTASAHATLIGSDPADGATLQAAPTTITLTFDDSLENFEPVVTVTGPDGNQYQSGPAAIDGATLSSAVAPLTAAGAYTIAYRVVSDDGHPVEGQVRFELAGPPTSNPTPGPTGPTTGSTTGSVGPSAPASASAAAPAASAVTSGPDTAASSSSGGWSPGLWLGVALLALLAFGGSVIVRRRLESRSRGGSDHSPGADG